MAALALVGIHVVGKVAAAVIAVNVCATGQLHAHQRKQVAVGAAFARCQALRLGHGSIVGAGIYTAGRVAEKSIENAGDNTNIQGDGNSYTQERVSSNSETSTRALGEGSNATSAAPVVSGPDKSSHTTIEAPEEPVVEEPEVEEPEVEEPEVEAPEVEEPAVE